MSFNIYTTQKLGVRISLAASFFLRSAVMLCISSVLTASLCAKLYRCVKVAREYRYRPGHNRHSRHGRVVLYTSDLEVEIALGT